MYIFSLFAILLPCLLAGMRSLSIGTDVEVYVTTLYDAALESANIKEFFGGEYYHAGTLRQVADMDIAFALLVYLTTIITGNLQIVLFLIAALIIIPLYYGLYRIKNIPIWIGMMTFYLLFYAESLNMMRQFIAISFIFLGTTYLFENNIKKFMGCAIVAIFFHISAIISIGIFLVYIILSIDKEFITKKGLVIKIDETKIIFFIITFSTLVVFNNEILMNVVETILGDYFVSYVAGNVVFMPNQLIKRLPIFILLIIDWKEYYKKNQYFSFLLIMIWFDFLMGQLYSANTYGGRIGYYFSYYLILLFSIIFPSSENSVKQNWNKLLIIGYMCFYWLFYTYLRNGGETMPYLFWFQ